MNIVEAAQPGNHPGGATRPAAIKDGAVSRGQGGGAGGFVCESSGGGRRSELNKFGGAGTPKATYYDADGSGSGVAVQIATLSTGLALTAANFFGI